MTSQPEKTNNCNAHIVQYLNIKDNQTMKFSQLIEENMINIFPEKSHRKCCKTSKLSISLDH